MLRKRTLYIVSLYGKVENTPWETMEGFSVKCEACLANPYDFVCPDCDRLICVDCGQQVVDHGGNVERTIWVCNKCVTGEDFQVSKVPDLIWPDEEDDLIDWEGILEFAKLVTKLLENH